MKSFKGRNKLKKALKIGNSLTVSLDLLIIFGLFFLFSLWGFHYLKEYKGHPEFYQKSFGPALMFACDKGFVNPKRVVGSSIDNFLSEKTEHFSPKDLPKDVKTEPFDILQCMSIYLLLAVGIVWKVVGISWFNVFFLHAILYGIMAALCYQVLRLALKRIYATIGTVVFCNFQLVMVYLPHLRDFSKAPFILAIILILGYMVTKETIAKTKKYRLAITLDQVFPTK